MWMVLLPVLVCIAAVIIFFNVPYSKTISEFRGVVNTRTANVPVHSEVFTEADLQGLPLPVQKYFRYCGYLGTPKMSYMKAAFQNVDFKMSADKTIKISYEQYNLVEKPERFALINSSLYGIPFEGLDAYQDGIGSMKGAFAKLVTLFDQRGENMDKACLVTILSECLIVPNVALQSYIKWEEIDDTHAKATISYYGISASGIFTFDGNGAMLSFKTKDRVATDMKGSTRQAEWSAIVSDYQSINGLKQPRVLQAVWHYPEGDSVYFNENKAGVAIEFR